jgi:hypothetical protein
MIRVRFGLRLKFPRGLFPNAGILVGRIDEDAFDEIADAVDILATALVFAGRQDWADLLVFEKG